MSREDFVKFEGVGVTYGHGKDQTEALCPTDLTISEGDFVALVGPSGCGKSTLLKLVSELLKPSCGHIFFGGRELGAKPVRVGMAFQSASLLPWMS
ncbi:MAG: ATP-binding cassette domain-containing protein, partial [Pseudomonadota bacterium]